MEDGWIEWNGGECPVDGDVEVAMRDGFVGSSPAPGLRWSHLGNDSDIVACRLHAANDNHPQEDAFMAPETPPLIEAGKWYRRRDGAIVGPVLPKVDDCGYPYVVGSDTYTEHGVFHVGYVGNLDLIEEASEPLADTAFMAPETPRSATPADVKAAIADEAKRIVTGARRAAYGKPEDNFLRIARFWTAYMQNTGRDVEITAGDVSPFMRLMKEARLCETPDHRDSYVDIVGYTLTGAEVNGVAA